MDNAGPMEVRLSATAQEQAAVRLATRRIAECLSAAGAEAVAFELQPDDATPTADQQGARLVIESLLPEVERFADPWSASEARVRARIDHRAAPDQLLYLMTVFRSVAADEDPATAAAKRVRIRRLNRLAVELSHQTGASIIDLDRALADVGAHALGTDFRLRGESAIEASARCIADAWLATALDDRVTATKLDAARIHLAGLARAWSEAGAALASATDLNMVAIRSSSGLTRSAQFFSTPESRISLHLRALASGKISPSDALARLLRAVRHHGLRRCTMLMWNGMTVAVVSLARRKRA